MALEEPIFGARSGEGTSSLAEADTQRHFEIQTQQFRLVVKGFIFLRF